MRILYDQIVIAFVGKKADVHYKVARNCKHLRNITQEFNLPSPSLHEITLEVGLLFYGRGTLYPHAPVTNLILFFTAVFAFLQLPTSAGCFFSFP